MDCCTSANTKWYLPSGVATTNGISSYGGGSSLGAIKLDTGGAASLKQEIHRCTLPESDLATYPSTISLYVGIYGPGQGECIVHLVTDFKVVINTFKAIIISLCTGMFFTHVFVFYYNKFMLNLFLEYFLWCVQN